MLNIARKPAAVAPKPKGALEPTGLLPGTLGQYPDIFLVVTAGSKQVLLASDG